MGVRIGIDSGGTFTDVMAVDEEGRIHTLKVHSTPESPDIGFENGLLRMLEHLEADASAVDFILHGTTVGINAILERRFPEVGLITTKGFRDILEIARQTVPGERGSIYHWVKPPRVVPLDRVFEVPERISASGEILTPLDTEEARRVAREIRERGIETVAISLLNSYARDDHEKQLKAIVCEEHPECHLAISSETLREFREYERTLTCCMNAVLMPILSAYVGALGRRLEKLPGHTPTLFVMKSTGGVVTASRAALQPLATAMSGPAAAVLGMSWMGKQCGFENIITFDMGGTSTDVSLIDSGKLPITPEAQLDLHTIRSPTVDVVSIGSGGGSIASLGPGERISVGPRSAGARPGPACYGKGGREPTVTDANLLLGRIPPYLVGGGVKLEPDLAEGVVRDFGTPLGLSAVEAAEGILEIAAFNMSDAIRQVSVRRGRDPRDFTLFALGGAGPLHACRVAQLLEIPTVLVPHHPGLGCALGLLVADVKDDFIATDIHRQDGIDLERLNRQFSDLEAQAVRSLEDQEIPEAQRKLVRGADLRYQGMASELTVEVPEGILGASEAGEIVLRFHQAHQDSYGYSYQGKQPVEIVNLRVSGVGVLPHLNLNPVDLGDPDASCARIGTRPVYFEEGGWVEECPIFARDRLRPGNQLQGPAVVEQYDTNTVVHPGQQLRVDLLENLVIRVGKD